MSETFSYDVTTEKNLAQWLDGGYSEETKQEVRRLLKEDPEAIKSAFYRSLSFGTGGLRGLLGVGPNRINIYNIGAYIQGLATYLNTQPKISSHHSVLIGYDSRHNSKEFAEQAAKVLAANGIKALIFKSMHPTPLVSFGCRYMECSAAVMITASHNPSEYSGCKLFWNDGAQVMAPHDQEILNNAKGIEDIGNIKVAEDLSHPLISEVDTDIDEAYLASTSRLQNYRDINRIEGDKLKIVYTSLHGAAYKLAPQALASWGFTNLYLVEKQIIPDGNFPTVKTPNPELIEALSMGISLLDKVGADILIAHDPDGDRVGVVVRHDGNHHKLTGNQVAALLVEHICEALTSQNKMAVNGAFIKSVVTTDLFSEITSYYQKPCFNVLPGFKYTAEKIRQWEENPRGRQFIFAAEDSCGYLLGAHVRDKDAIATSNLICEMALQAKLKGKTLVDTLHELYSRHGIYHEELFTWHFGETKEGRDRILRGVEMLLRRPIKELEKKKVVVWEDYRRSTKVNFITHHTENILLPKADLLIFTLEDGSKLALRPSGTEPKLKIYCSVMEKLFSSIDEGLKVCKERACSLISALKAILDEDLDL